MENSTKSNYWLNLDTYDLNNDPDLKILKNNFILGNKIQEDKSTNEIELNIEINKKYFIKKISVTDLIPTENDKSISSSNLSNLNKFTIYEVVHNILNNFNNRKYFNYLEDQIILTYLKYPITNFRENYFENYLLVQDYQTNIFQNPDYSHKHFEHLKENMNKILNQEKGLEVYDEMYLKIIENILNKNKNILINFLSTSHFDKFSNNYEEILFFIQIFSCYNKHKSFREKEIKNKFDREYKIFDLVYAAMKLLSIFGCSTVISNLNSDNLIVPRFNYKIKFLLDKDLNHCLKVKIDVSSFNRNIFDILNENRTFNIFHILPKFLTQNLSKEFNLEQDLKKYKFFKNYEVNKLIKEDVYDEENYILLFDNLFKTFKFNDDEINLIIQLISFILNLSNLDFDVDKSYNVYLKNVEIIRKCLKLSDNVTDQEISNLFLFDSTTGRIFTTVEKCKNNITSMMKDVYENLFYFIVKKINQELDNKNLNDLKIENTKEIVIDNIFYQNNENLNNPFDLFNFYLSEKGIRNFEEIKIEKILTNMKSEGINNNEKVEYEYDKLNQNNLDIFEKVKNILNSELESTENDLLLNNLEFVSKINIVELKQNNIILPNKNLTDLLNILENDNTNKSQNSSDEKIKNNLEFVNKTIFQIFNMKLIGQRNLLQEFLYNNDNILNINFDNLFLLNLSDNFVRDYNIIILQNNLLKTLKRFKIKSFVENITYKFNHEFNFKQFVNRFYIPVMKASNQEEKYKEASEEILINLKSEENDYIFGINNVFLKNSVFLKLKNIENVYQSELQKKGQLNKVLAVVKAFSVRKSYRNSKVNNVNSIIQIEENKNLEGFSSKDYIDSLFKDIDNKKIKKFDVGNFNYVKYTDDLLDRIYRQFDENKSLNNERENKFVIISKENNIKNSNDANDDTVKIKEENNPYSNKIVNIDNNNSPKKVNLKNQNNQINSINKLTNNTKITEITETEKLEKIQNFWRTKRDNKVVTIMREKIFIIQRNFRRLLIKKYDLPDNYFYNEKFLRIQHEKYEKNYVENMKILFPAMFNDYLTNKINEENNNNIGSNSRQNTSSNISNHSSIISNTVSHSSYETGKIHLFGKVLDVDLMVESDETYENLWAKSFDKVHSHCLKANAPINLISLGNAHTLCVNNKSRLYSFGWNNYGQCGVPTNSTIIAKDEIDNEFLVEMTEFNELRPRVLNKVEGIKFPQIEEVIQTKSVACGEDHTLVLDHEGGIWSFGLNLNGQLGLGHNKVSEKPTKIKSLNKQFITNIKSEGDINFAVSRTGDAYMWPWSDKNGNLMPDPIRLNITNNEKINTVACGNNFVLLLTQNGAVYSMGRSNKYGQLGHGDTKPKFRPTMIEFFQINSERISQISCGFKHCVAKSTIGKGVKGQLGHGDFNNYTLPYQVKIDTPLTKVLQVSAGFRSTFFLIESRKIFFVGCNGTVSMQNYPIPFIPEFSNELNYSVVKIMNSWSKSMSIFYATIADCTMIKGISPPKLNQILHNLASKWDSDSVDVPSIETISKYFPINYMKSTNTKIR